MNKQLFSRYAELKRQITVLQTEINELQPHVLTELKALPDAKLKMSLGTFSLVRRVQWAYSEEVVRLAEEVRKKVTEFEEEVTAKKKTEEENGIAKAEYKESILFRAKAPQVESW